MLQGSLTKLPSIPVTENVHSERKATRLKSVLVVDRENTAISKTPETIFRQ